MMAMKVAVAFHTMPQTTGMSVRVTTPSNSATAAPPIALQPICRPFGCQITRVMVTAKIRRATIMGRLRIGRPATAKPL